MKIGKRTREGQDIFLLLVLRHHSRCNIRDLETAAAEEPERTDCGYGDNAMDATGTEEGPSTNAQAGVVQAAEEWATTVDDAAAWSNVALADDTEAP